jgi:PII-like signaling protein
MVKEARIIIKVVDNSAQVKRALNTVNSMASITYI